MNPFEGLRIMDIIVIGELLLIGFYLIHQILGWLPIGLWVVVAVTNTNAPHVPLILFCIVLGLAMWGLFPNNFWTVKYWRERSEDEIMCFLGSEIYIKRREFLKAERYSLIGGNR